MERQSARLWWCGLLVATAIATAGFASPPDDADATLRVFAAAHDSATACEVWYWIPGFESPEVAPLFERAKASGGELTRSIDAETGRAVWRTNDYHLVGDGAGNVRLEIKSLLEGGPEALRTRVQIWRPDERATVPRIGADRGTLERFDVLTPDEQVRLRSRGRVPYAEERAGLGYPQAARYAIEMLTGASDLRVDKIGAGDAAVLSSHVRGVSAKVDAHTGELLRLRVQTGLNAITLMEFTGRFDEKLFPARHPREVRIAYPGGDEAKAWGGAAEQWATRDIPADLPGGRMLIERVEPLMAVPEGEFNWRTLVRSVYDSHAGVVFWADSRDPEAASAAAMSPMRGSLGGVVGIDEGPARPVTAKNRWSSRRLAAEVGIACGVLGLAALGRMWWGRRALRTGAAPRSGSR